jgi:hypothetical protein
MDWLDPLSKLSHELTQGYPLTREELRHLAVQWAAVRRDMSVFCALASQMGTTDLWIEAYTADRLGLIAGILGESEMALVYQRADELVREKIGDEWWTAYLQGSPRGEEQ